LLFQCTILAVRQACGWATEVTGAMAVSRHNFKRFLRRILWVALFIAAGIAVTAYLGYRRLALLPEAGLAPKAELEAMVVERVHQSATREGRTEWSLDAATAQYQLTEKKVLLSDLSVTFFTRDDQKVYLTARHGTVSTDSHDMQTHGQVVIYNDAYRLETEKMVYSHASRLITSDVPVKITGPAGDLMADSLTLDLSANRLVMRGHVHGTLAANQAP
jgi:LPS export ABC transporter protein LptC